MLNESIVTWFV